jgi:hypothetical protein
VFVIYAPARASSPAFRFLCWKHCPPTSGLYVMNVVPKQPPRPRPDPRVPWSGHIGRKKTILSIYPGFRYKTY